MIDSTVAIPPKRLYRRTFYRIWILFAGMYALFGLLPSVAESSHLTPDAVLLAAVAVATPILAALAEFRFNGDPDKYLPFLFRTAMPLYVPSVMGLFMGVRITPAIACFLALFWGAAVYSAARQLSLFRDTSRIHAIGASVQAWCAGWVLMQLLVWITPEAFVLAVMGPFIFLIMLVLFHSLIDNAIFLFLAAIVGIVLCFLPISPRRKKVAVLSFSLVALLLFLCNNTSENPLQVIAAVSLVICALICLAGFLKWYVWDSFTALYASAGALFPGTGKRVLFCALSLVFVSLAYTLGTGEYRSASIRDLTAHSLPQERKKEVARTKETYRAMLADMYLAPIRYPLTESSFSHDRRLKTRAIAWSLRPFLYPGTTEEMRNNQRLAAETYKELFGVPIENGEHGRIANATRLPETEPGPAFDDKRHVYLASQELHVRESGEWADMELHEEYRNTGSNQNEKVTLYFRLPPGAVITDLWISDNSRKKFQATVSPRGAAQKTFNRIVRRGQDPALVEQIGSDMYKLQLFPVAPEKNGTPFHVWLHFRCLKQRDDVWLLPMLTRSTNVRRDKGTSFTLNGKPLSRPKNWLPEFIPVAHRSAPVPQLVGAGDRVLSMEPRKNAATPEHRPLAVYLDTSLSMHDKKHALLRAAKAIRHGWEGEVSFHIWENGWQKVPYPLEKRLDAHVFWGRFSLEDLSRTPEKEKGRFAIPVVLTSGERLHDPYIAEAPVTLMKGTWICPVDEFPATNVAEPLLRNLAAAAGGLAWDIPQMLAAIAAMEIRWETPGAVHVDERYIWLEGGAAPGVTRIDDARVRRKGRVEPKTIPREPLAVHTIVSKAGRAVSLTPDELDGLQRLAVQGHVVTPYSSMIALVEDWQREMLRKAEQDKDRFERREESAYSPTAVLPQRPDGVSLPGLGATAVPEPEEWALILVVTCILLRGLYSKRTWLPKFCINNLK